jgi:hypothetical protein
VVLAVVREAIYLVDERGQVTWLAGEESPMHGRAVRYRDLPEDVRQGEPWRAEPGQLRFPVSCVLTEGAPTWDPRRRGAVDPTSWKHLAERVAEVFGAGLVFTADRSWSADGLRALVGRGPGLTPAGDDFLGGLLFAAYHLREGYPGVGQDLPRGFSPAEIESLTTRLSAAILMDLAMGEGPEPLHDLMDCLMGKLPSPAGRAARFRLARLGASTGLELMAGVLEAINLWLPRAVA